jgi:UDP:flavonoid glycosyltransferase YjiC (YdhE family)
MNIVILSMGTRGDLQPSLAIGKALQAQGHKVRVYAGSNFKSWIEQNGLEALPSTTDSRQKMESELGRSLVSNSHNVLKQALIWRKMAKDLKFSSAQMLLDLCRDCEVFISDSTTETFAMAIAEMLGARHVRLLYQPSFSPTRSGDIVFGAPLPGKDHVINYLYAKYVAAPTFWKSFEGAANRFRKEMRIRTLNHAQHSRERADRLTLMGYSRHIVPHPDDWPATFHTTGYWFLDELEQWQPPQALLDFLEAGPAPVYIGFGSMVTPDAQKVAAVAIEATRRAGKRALLAAGWAGLRTDDLPKIVFQIDAAPHQWLFPRMAAVVHHGGAGTTAAALRAGVPNIIVPHFGDQQFWAWRLRTLGLAPEGIPRHKLNAANLSRAILDATEDEALRQRVNQAGGHIRDENGVDRAIKLIEDYLGCRQGRPAASGEAKMHRSLPQTAPVQ